MNTKTTWTIILLAFGAFVVETCSSVIAGIIMMISDDIHISVSLAGQLVTVFSFAFAIGSPILITLTARVERKKVLYMSLILFILGNIIMIFSHSFGFLVISRILTGVSAGTYAVTAISVATKLVTPEKRGKAIGIMLMGNSAPLVIGVPLGTILASAFGWRWIFVIIAVFSLICIIAIRFVVPRMQGQEAVHLKAFFSILKNARIISALLMSFMYISGYAVLYTYFTPFLQKSAGMNTAVISAALLMAGVCSVFGSHLGGYASDRWGAKPTIYISLIAHTIILFILPFTTTTILGAIISLMFWAIAAWITAPAQQYYLITLSPEATEIALSMNTSIFQLGFGTGAAVGGGVIAHVSALNLSWVAGISIFIGLLAIFFSFSFNRRTLGNEA